MAWLRASSAASCKKAHKGRGLVKSLSSEENRDRRIKQRELLMLLPGAEELARCEGTEGLDVVEQKCRCHCACALKSALVPNSQLALWKLALRMR